MKWFPLYQSTRWRGWIYTSPEVHAFLLEHIGPNTSATAPPPDRWFRVIVQNTYGSVEFGQKPGPQFAGWFWGREPDTWALSTAWVSGGSMLYFEPYG